MLNISSTTRFLTFLSFAVFLDCKKRIQQPESPVSRPRGRKLASSRLLAYFFYFLIPRHMSYYCTEFSSNFWNFAYSTPSASHPSWMMPGRFGQTFFRSKKTYHICLSFLYNIVSILTATSFLPASLECANFKYTLVLASWCLESFKNHWSCFKKKHTVLYLFCRFFGSLKLLFYRFEIPLSHWSKLNNLYTQML